jgi:hypothetical protein
MRLRAEPAPAPLVAPTRLRVAQARPPRGPPMQVAPGCSVALPKKVPQEPPAPQSWERPMKMPQRARSTTAREASPAERWPQPRPSRSTLGWGQGRQVGRRPTMERPRRQALLRPEAIPRSEPAVPARRPVAPGQVRAEVRGPWARRAVAPPRLARAELRWHPSWLQPEGEAAAPQVVREVRTGAAGAATRPMFAPRAGSVQASAHPRSELPAEEVRGEQRPQERRSTLGDSEAARPAAGPAAARRHPRPRWPGLASPGPADPSWAPLQGGPRRLARQGSARARQLAEPRWSRFLPDETRQLSAAEMMGEQAARSGLACDAGA